MTPIPPPPGAPDSMYELVTLHPPYYSGLSWKVLCCTACGAVVGPDWTTRHDEFHARLAKVDFRSLF